LRVGNGRAGQAHRALLAAVYMLKPPGPKYEVESWLACKSKDFWAGNARRVTALISTSLLSSLKLLRCT
jgi:hypothetical protein